MTKYEASVLICSFQISLVLNEGFRTRILFDTVNYFDNQMIGFLYVEKQNIHWLQPL